jgi:hypothetical protein
MRDTARHAGHAFDEDSDRHGDASRYEPPRLVVMGSLEELTRGNATAATDGGAFSEGSDRSTAWREDCARSPRGPA